MQKIFVIGSCKVLKFMEIIQTNVETAQDQNQRKLSLMLGFSLVAAIFNGSLACVAYQTHF